MVCNNIINTELIALSIQFHGGILGLQINPGVETVEKSLFASLHKANFISDSNFNGGASMVKVSWSRCARTDAGVHALCQVINDLFSAFSMMHE